VSSCSGEKAPATPLETFKTYTKAIKQKDTTTMKLLLSSESIKMHEQQAKEQGVTLDDIVKRETLFTEGQTTVQFRNEKIDGERATLEVKSAAGIWQTVPFVFEDGQWKIDKKTLADQMIQDIEQTNDQQLNDIINQDRQP
jgi:anti-sigma28 factor (negative regulator of flagellin synthesis)